MAQKTKIKAKSRAVKVAAPARTVKAARVAKATKVAKISSKTPVTKAKSTVSPSNKANAAKLAAQRAQTARVAAAAKGTAAKKPAPKAQASKAQASAASKTSAQHKPLAPQVTHKVGSAKAAVKPVVAKLQAGVRPVAPKAHLAAAAPASKGNPGVAPAPVRAVPAAVAKPANQKISAPAPTPVALPASTPKVLAEKAAAARAVLAANKKPVSARHGFKTNEYVVYPAHGVGRIVGIEEQEIAGMSLELFVITFDKEKLTLRVPTGKLQSVGMRKLAEDGIVKRAMETLKGRARVKRTMWSRRAQEYVAKINSGDLISIAEVVRDLFRSEAQPEQSYSERQLYEDALERMARELAAVERMDERGAVQRIVEILSKSAKGRRLAAEEAEAAATTDTDVKAA